MAKLIKPLMLIAVFGLMAFTSLKSEEAIYTSIHTVKDSKIKIPKEVQKIIDKKCMGCHKPDSRNRKGKKKLQWEKLVKLDKKGQKKFVGALFEVLEEQSMPPKRMLQRYPKMKLTAKESAVLLAWAEKLEKKLK
ncbi:MAG: heme-binding domain-containing protein [Flavobacteriaceae bacterium]|nr:heme-binding domain-containing protein [Flavobacteriaceae bacterium]